MSTPKKAVTRFTEHEQYAEFLGTLNRAELIAYISSDNNNKENQFLDWVAEKEIEDFKNLVPMHIRMNADEWNWFQARLAEEYTEKLPNLRALSEHPPKAFKDLD